MLLWCTQGKDKGKGKDPSGEPPNSYTAIEARAIEFLEGWQEGTFRCRILLSSISYYTSFGLMFSYFLIFVPTPSPLGVSSVSRTLYAFDTGVEIDPKTKGKDTPPPDPVVESVCASVERAIWCEAKRCKRSIDFIRFIFS